MKTTRHPLSSPRGVGWQVKREVAVIDVTFYTAGSPCCRRRTCLSIDCSERSPTGPGCGFCTCCRMESCASVTSSVRSASRNRQLRGILRTCAERVWSDPAGMARGATTRWQRREILSMRSCSSACKRASPMCLSLAGIEPVAPRGLPATVATRGRAFFGTMIFA
jgi:hypothetical protein